MSIGGLFPEIASMHLTGAAEAAARERIIRGHYTRSVPSGKARYYQHEDAVVVYAIPANPYIGKFLLGRDGCCWELSRLWAPDGHRPTLLTEAIGVSFRWLLRDVVGIDVVVSYADPNVGHHGGVYRAASWLYTGQADEGRYYVSPEGVVVARRKFHSGREFTRKAGILALGYQEMLRPGRHRYVRGATRVARRELARRWA